MTARRAAILRLLDTRDEHLPHPVRRTQARTGFVNEARARTCPDCLANGRTMKGCETCGGSGVVTGRRLAAIAAPDALPDDESKRDPYTSHEVVPFGFDPTRHDASHDRDRQIEALARQLAPRPLSLADELAEANQHPYAWEIARRRMYEQFDYAALDRALEQLHSAHPGLSPRSEHGLALLEALLPDPLRAPGVAPAATVRGPLRPEAGVSAKELRDGEMRQRARAGASLEELAAEFRVSARTVYRVVSEAA